VTEIERYSPVPAEGGGRPTPEQFVNRFLATRRSPHTRFSYGLDIGVRVERPGAKEGSVPKPGRSRAPDWLTFCRAGGLDPLGHVRQEHIGLWARAMEKAGLSAPTVARKIASVSSWYAWMKSQGYAPANPAADLPRPQIDGDTSKTPGVTKEQALAMLRYADVSKWPMAARNRALVAVLLFTGARASEIVGATVGDLGMDRGHQVLWVTRKGGKPQGLVLPPPALSRVREYLADRGDVNTLPAVPGEPVPGKPFLFLTAGGKPMPTMAVWRTMRSVGRAAGLPDELTSRMGAHSMRHSFATLYLDAGGSLRDLQDAMGHKDPRTTRRYDRARGVLDRSPGYKLAEYLADGS
jgi:integrase/recombinase XerD